MDKRDLHFYDNTFKELENGISISGIRKESNIELFARELKQLMEKHKIKAIYPTHRTNAQITRHIRDNDLHIVGMIFESE